MYGKVVDDEVNALAARARASQFLQKPYKEPAVFLLPLGPHYLPTLRLQDSCQVSLVVLTGRNYLLLLAAHHPVESDLRVQVDVDLILEEGHLIRRKMSESSPDFLNSFFALILWLGAPYDRPGPIPARPHLGQDCAHGRFAETDASFSGDLLNQQPARPAGAFQPKIRRAYSHQLDHPPDLWSHFRWRPVASAVAKAGKTGS